MNTTPIMRTLRSLVVPVAALMLAVPGVHAADEPLRMTFVNQNTSYGSTDQAWILFSYTGTAANEFTGTVLGTGPESGAIVFTAGAGPSAGSYFSEIYQITDLAAGVELSAAPSTRIYVSLGQALDPKPSSTTPSSPFSDFGSPSLTATADPNWNVRWDFFETTLSTPRSASDYGDLSVINQFGIPLQIDTYKSATDLTPANLLQSARTAQDPAALQQQLTALAALHVGNNDFVELPGDWHIRTPPGAVTAENPFPDTFLRQVGPASGGTEPEWIGPFPSMNDYAAYIDNGGGTPKSAPLTGTTSVKDTLQQAYTMTTTAARSETNALAGIRVSGTIETSTWDALASTWNPPTTDGKTYEMRIALDSNVGTPSADYSLSNALYGSAWQDNSGISYWITDQAITTPVTQQAFLASVSSNSTMALQTVNQWMQNVFVGYNFGLVGNDQTVSGLSTSAPHLSGVSLNDMGSAGWADLKLLIDQGLLANSHVPFFTLTDSESRPLYNQWAKIVFDQSETAYGTQYSDMFQPLLALYTYQSNIVGNEYQSTAENVLSWQVTILADHVPEPGAFASAALALGVLGAISLPRTRCRRGDRAVLAA